MSTAVDSNEVRDADLERRIDDAYTRMVSAKSDDASREAFAEMAVLIRRRSPDQVLKLELELRLRRRDAVDA